MPWWVWVFVLVPFAAFVLGLCGAGATEIPNEVPYRDALWVQQQQRQQQAISRLIWHQESHLRAVRPDIPIESLYSIAAHSGSDLLSAAKIYDMFFNQPTTWRDLKLVTWS